MSTKGRKRQKTDPSPEKPNTKTLFHFFAKPNGNGAVASEPSPPKTESDTSSVNGERRRHSDGVFGAADTMKTDTAPSRISGDWEISNAESNSMHLEAS